MTIEIASRESRRRGIVHYGVRFTLFAAVAAVVLASEPFWSPFSRDVLTRAFAFAILALSLDILWGYAGVLSFGQAAFFGVGAYGIGIAAVHIGQGLMIWIVSAVVAVLLGCVIAGIVGSLAFYTRLAVPALYTAVLTLAFGEVLRQLIIGGTKYTGGTGGLTGFAVPFWSSREWFLLSASTLLGLTVLTWILVRSDFGTVLAAVRDNELRSQYLGFNTPFIKLVLFAAVGGMAATSGVLYATYTTALSPPLIDFTLATDAVIWTAVGGRGTLVGPVLGALSIIATGATLSSQFPLIWQLFLGLLFVFVVLVMPRGIFPMLIVFIQTLIASGRRTALLERLPRLTPRGSATRVVTVSQAANYHEEAPVELEARGLNKRFGSLEALRGVSLKVGPGEILAVVGPNGAGKSTLINCIADGRIRDAGEIQMAAKPVGNTPPYRIVAEGVGRKFQAATVFESLTVADSLRLAGWKGSVPSLWRRSQTIELSEAVQRVLSVTGLNEALDETTRNLSHGLKQALELCMVLALGPKVLLLDEPTAGLTTAERDSIADVLKDLAGEERLAIVLIEHDFEFVKRISSRMLVLHEGEVVLEGSVAEIAGSEIVRNIYLGRGR